MATTQYLWPLRTSHEATQFSAHLILLTCRTFGDKWHKSTVKRECQRQQQSKFLQPRQWDLRPATSCLLCHILSLHKDQERYFHMFPVLTGTLHLTGYTNFTFLCLEQGSHNSNLLLSFPLLKPHNFCWFHVPSLRCVKCKLMFLVQSWTE